MGRYQCRGRTPLRVRLPKEFPLKVLLVYNPSYSGLLTLSRTHLQDLIETTAQIHYEAFRSKQLLALKDASARNAQQPAA